MNIIAELWNGNLHPVENLGKSNYAVRKLERLMAKNYEELENELNDSSKRILSNYYSCIQEYIVLMSEEAFCDGFGMGVHIITEAINGYKKQE